MALKTYRVEVNTQPEVEAIEFLIKSYITKGKNLTDAVVDYASAYSKKAQRTLSDTLVTEKQLLVEAKKLGLTPGKSSVVQYRRKGVLQDSKGPWYFQNSQNKVVYKLEKMIEFLKARNIQPKSRIKKTKLST